MEHNNGLTSGPLKSSLSGSSIPNPSWGLVFGLTLVVVLIGFFVVYLIFRMSKQEKMLDVINKRSQNIPTPDDVFGMIQQCYHSPQFQQPMMRNIHSMVETRLNDFDEYCQSKYGNTTDNDEPGRRGNQHSGDIQVYTSGASDGTHDHPPPLEDQQRQIPPQQPQSLLSVSSGPQPFLPPPPPPPPSSSSQHPVVPASSGGGTSMLAEALPSLLTSLLSGGLGGGSSRSGAGNSAGGDVTFPVIIGDIMTLMSNQRARQQRREEMAPSSNVTDSASLVESSSSPNNA
jgi:hypothetical protein